MSRLNLAIVVLVCSASIAWAQEAPLAAPDALPSLDSVRWADASVDRDALRGKSVVVLVYGMDNVECNHWSGMFFRALKAAIKDKPVVVLAICADENASDVKKYLTDREFFAPNVLHGYDLSMPKRLGFDNNLFYYIWFGPDGTPHKTGNGGSYYKTSKDKKKYVLPTEIGRLKNCGTFDFITPEMSDKVRAAFWPWELGRASEKSLRAACEDLDLDEKKEVDAGVERYMDGQLERVRKLYKGSLLERIEAYEIATTLSGMFKATSQSQKAQKVVALMNADREFKKELAAKRVYDGIIEKAAGDPNRRAMLLRAFIKRFDATHYGKLAKESLASGLQ